MKHLDLFSGIGGFALAVEEVWPNSEHVFCDNDSYCQRLLKLRFPNSKIYEDIKEIKSIANSFGKRPHTTKNKQELESKRSNEFCVEQSRNLGCIDLLTGGFPCQPFSQAGKRRGTDDDRYLWPEMLRVIRLTKPRWVIAENVRGLFTMQNGMVFEQVCLDLENSGYEIQPFIIPAVAVNAPHRRDRIWFVAHAVGDTADRKKKSGKLSEASGKQKQVRAQHGSARQSLRTAFGGRGERFEKNSLVAAAFGNAEGARQSSGDERQGKTQYGRTSSGSDKCVASDTESERKRRVAGKERGIEKRTMEQSKSKRSEIRCESKRCIGHASHSERDGYAERYQKAGRKKRSGKKRWVFKFERKSWERSWLEVATELCGVDDGLSAELDGLELSKSRHRIERLKALGNAIVPQVAIEIMRAIRKTEESIGDT
ncbi:MAG TPA: DNA (cytosine-5-)-methyltransferase [Candidatus Omnitrophota bacterium]|jgi:DNA (cytosine-5)-methyltransferase 1|nr:DNA (cytosine-5-)-methyltransferase [Candidatus Omnitrophota bacterium]HSA08036.1 DNA (cytosine-5-)-methyltransferase [Candidatus Moranbacteria bacterium]